MIVGDLSRRELGERLAGDGLALQFGPFNLTIRSNLASFASLAHQLYEPYPLPDADGDQRFSRPDQRAARAAPMGTPPGAFWHRWAIPFCAVYRRTCLSRPRMGNQLVRGDARASSAAAAFGGSRAQWPGHPVSRLARPWQVDAVHRAGPFRMAPPLRRIRHRAARGWPAAAAAAPDPAEERVDRGDQEIPAGRRSSAHPS